MSLVVEHFEPLSNLIEVVLVKQMREDGFGMSGARKLMMGDGTKCSIRLTGTKSARTYLAGSPPYCAGERRYSGGKTENTRSRNKYCRYQPPDNGR